MEINKMQKLCKAKFAAGYEEERDTNEAQAVLFVVWFFLIAGVKGVGGGLSRSRGRCCLYSCCVQRPLTIPGVAAALDGYGFIWVSARAQCAPSVCIIVVSRGSGRVVPGERGTENGEQEQGWHCVQFVAQHNFWNIYFNHMKWHAPTQSCIILIHIPFLPLTLSLSMFLSLVADPSSVSA